MNDDNSIMEKYLHNSTLSNDDLIHLIYHLLSSPKIMDSSEISDTLMNNPDFKKLYDYIIDLRDLSAALNRGDLQKFVYSKGFILANLKALQSNLRHLTWQTHKIAEGDFTQKVDFLGEFSDSFNEMTIKLKNANLQLTKLASLDALTQIPNRMTLDNFLNRSFLEAKDKNTSLSIILFDIDHFKRVNDTYGHSAGDKALIEVSSVLNKQFRATDVFARYGGEEFVAVLPNASIEVVEKIAERCLHAVEDTKIAVTSDSSVSVTISIGISELRKDDTSYESITKRSDLALYKSKNNGRNQLTIVL